MEATEEIQDIGEQEPQTPPPAGPQDPPPQEPKPDKVKELYDAVSEDYDLGDYNTYKEKLKDPAKRKALYDAVGEEYDLGNFDEFDKKITSSLGPQLRSIEDLRGLHKTATNDPEFYSPSNPSVKTMSQNDPAFAATMATAGKDYDQEIKNYGEAWGVDENELKQTFNDFPSENRPDKIKELLKMKKDRPADYTRFKAADENKNLIAGSENGGVHLANEYNDLQGDENMPIQNFKDLQNTIQRQREIILQSLSGADREKALNNLAINKGMFFNPYSEEIQKQAESDPLSSTLNPTQYAGLEYLKSFRPEQYELYVKKLAVDSPEPDKMKGYKNPLTGEFSHGKEQDKLISKKIGRETMLQNLQQIGRGNTMQYFNDQAQRLTTQYDASTDPDEREEIRTKFADLQIQAHTLQSDISQDDNRFPYLSELKFDNQVKELTQDPNTNFLSYGLRRFQEGFKKSNRGMDQLFTEVFGSDKQNAEMQLETLGSAQREASDFYLPESMRTTGSPFVYKFHDSLSEEADKIRKDPNLTSDQKRERLLSLVTYNQDKVDYVTNPKAGKSANFFSKATLYANSGMVGDILSFAAQSAVLNAAGAKSLISNGIPMFLSAQDDFYKQAVADGNPNPSQYAALHAAIMFAAGAINPDIKIVRNALGLDSKVGKMIAGVSENTWNEVIAGNKPLLTKIQNSLKASLKEGAKLATVFGAGTSLANDAADRVVFNKNISKEEMAEHAVHSMREMATSSLTIMGINAVTHFRSASPEQKAAIWELGHNPKLGLERIDESLANGEINQGQADHKKAIIKNVAKVIERIPSVDSNGKPLTDRQRIDMMYGMIIKGKIGEMKGDLPDNVADKLAGISKLIDIDTGETIDPGSKKGAIISELNDLKFGEKSPWKTVEGNGGQLLKDIQEQATGWHRSTEEVGSPLSFNNLHNVFPEHIIEAAVRALSDEDKKHITDMYDVSGYKVPQKLKDYLHVPKVEPPKVEAGPDLPVPPVDESVKPSVVMPEDNKAPNVVTPVKTEKIPFADFREHALNMYEHLSDSKFDWAVTNREMSGRERQKGIKDIRAGKDTVPARKIEAHIKEMYESGIMTMNRGRGNHAATVDYPFEDLGFTHETINGIEKNLYQYLEKAGEETPIDTEFVHSQTENNAATKQSPNAVDVRQQTGDGTPMGTGDTGHTEPAGAQGEGTETTSSQNSVKEKVTQLETERDAEINKVTKPKAPLEFISPKDLARFRDPIGSRVKQNEIKEKYKQLKRLIDCLWA